MWTGLGSPSELMEVTLPVRLDLGAPLMRGTVRSRSMVLFGASRTTENITSYGSSNTTPPWHCCGQPSGGTPHPHGNSCDQQVTENFQRIKEFLIPVSKTLSPLRMLSMSVTIL